MKRDLKNNLGAVVLLSPVDAESTDKKSAALPVTGYDGVMLMAVIGTLTGVDGDNCLTPKLQHSDTLTEAGFADVDASEVHGGFTAVTSGDLDDVVQCVGYRGTKPYVRVVLDYSGSGITAGIVSVLGLLGYPRRAPVVGPAALAVT